MPEEKKKKKKDGGNSPSAKLKQAHKPTPIKTGGDNKGKGGGQKSPKSKSPAGKGSKVAPGGGGGAKVRSPTAAGAKPTKKAWDDKESGKSTPGAKGKAGAGKAGAGAGKPGKPPGGRAKGRRRQRGFLSKMWRSTFGRFVGGEKVVLETPDAREAAEALALTDSQLRTLKRKFEMIDIDNSGSIDSEEFFEMLGEQRSPFTDALFALIDADGSGTIDFDEYVRVLISYCMYTKEDILKFCFDFFDVDGSGTIDEAEFIELCKTVNNAAPMFPGNFANAIEMFDVNDDGLIDFSEFVEIDRRFPLVLFPAFRLQNAMQKQTLGEAGWKSINEAVVRQQRINEYMELHGGKEPPDSVMTKFLKMLGLVNRKKVHVDKIVAARPAAAAKVGAEAM